MTATRKKTPPRNWRPFEEARAYVHTLGLKSARKWGAWANSTERPSNIPANPYSVYKDSGWINWGDWLGTRNRKGGYRPFKEARAFVRNLGLKDSEEWSAWTKSDERPNDIPAAPQSAYKDKGWVSMGDWLGTRNRKGGYLPFEEARAFVRSLKLQGPPAWRAWAKSDERPDDVPIIPSHVYKDKGWVSLSDWLGTRIGTRNRKGGYLPFQEARVFVHSLGLQSQVAWNAWAKSDARPDNIPIVPHDIYKNKGWVSTGDWLGTGRIANQNKIYRPFEEARAYVQSLELQGRSAWRAWLKSDTRPDDIPTTPERVYKSKGWVSFGDWLGTGRIAPQNMIYLSFEKARVFVHSLGLQGRDDWVAWAKSDKRPIDIPASPRMSYKDKGWVSWGDWLGTGRIAPQDKVFRPFEEARAFVRSLDLPNQTAWNMWAKSADRPHDIPSGPPKTYKDDGWVDWGDWLGTGRIASQNMMYRSFIEARIFARSLEFQNQITWREWSKSNERPADIPADPANVYKSDGWAGWGDWLGTRNRKGGYRPFNEARMFTQRLGFQRGSDWRKWAKSNARPVDIPANPAGVYKGKGWVNWGDWLGIKHRKSGYLSFEEARAFARDLGLQNQITWHDWAKSDKRPIDIPANPAGVYKGKGWVSWGDWLGTKHRKSGYLSFEEARTFAQNLKLANKTKWGEWSKTSDRPDNIPANPAGVYKGKGWVSWGDWLGTGNVVFAKKGFLPFNEARKFARGLGLKSSVEWHVWAKTNARPENIPNNALRAYKDYGWIGWGDWLGTGNIASKNRSYLPFDPARSYAQALGLSGKDEWMAWSKTAARPESIPADPRGIYKNDGWVNWGDWLGTGSIATKNRVYRSFKDARSYARSLGIKSQAEWHVWKKTSDKPDDMPANPDLVYQTKGWLGWGDWLGVINLWNKNAILSFLYGIKPILRDLQAAELYAIMRQNGMIASSKNAANTNAPLIQSIRDLCSSPNPEADFKKLSAEIERENQLLDEDLTEEQLAEVEVIEATGAEELPALRSLQALKAVDELVQAGIISDEETIEFLIANRVSGLWQAALNNDGAIDLEALRAEPGGVYFEAIRSRFLAQHDGAQSLAIPRGYDFRVDGKLAQPNLMQKLAAYRILTEKRLGNWSGVGAGKTLSAILASRVADARLTVIVAFNSTVDPWAKRVEETYPDSVIHIKERGAVRIDPAKHTYLILNFETFQQPDSAAFVEALVAKHQIDFVVLDEIQSVKQRTPKVTSKRRQVVGGLLTSAHAKNPDLRVLGMSATPVINNLYEAKALLELVKGVAFDDLETLSNIPNAIAMHEKLILYGIRYRPQYAQTIATEFKEIQGNAFLAQLAKLPKRAMLDLERILLDAKLETIIASLKKGTLIYTHYLTGLVTPLRRAIEQAGYKVGLFTGEDKSGLEPFKQGKVDVLIGSVPVGTGVDGLQYICNRMIVVSLPWTSAEYEQLIGRLYRQGSAFDKVEVIVPQVVLEHHGDIWSWDKMRMNRIQYKKTLADAAMDGVIPEGELSSPDTMLKKAREALQAWIARIEADGVAVIERAQLRVPLPKETAHIIQRRFGDLSVMNSRFNTAYSRTTHERFNQNPEEWYLYHTLYREARKDWAEIPFEKIAKALKKRPDWVIGDFGCGEAKLAKLLPNQVHSFDHVAINETVTACDMTHTPLDEATLDVAVFSLSLMGLNYADYLKEAHRTLRFGGFLKIAEPVSRWAEKRAELLSTIAEVGFLLVGNVEEANQFFYIDAIKQ